MLLPVRAVNTLLSISWGGELRNRREDVSQKQHQGRLCFPFQSPPDLTDLNIRAFYFKNYIRLTLKQTQKSLLVCACAIQFIISQH